MKYDKRNSQHRFMVSMGRAFVDRNGDLVQIPSPRSPYRTPFQERARKIAAEVDAAREIFLRSPNTPATPTPRFA